MGKSEELNDPSDPLAERLRREAMQERPDFSRQLHQRILRQVRAIDRRARQRSSNPSLVPWHDHWRWFAVGAAAAGIVGYMAISPWWMQAHRAEPDDSKAIVRNIPQRSTEPQSPVSSLAAVEHTVNVGGILYARLLPPGITVRLPENIVDQPPAPERVELQPASTTAPPGSPEWLFGSVEQPWKDSASAALADVMPPEAHFLIGLARSQQ